MPTSISEEVIAKHYNVLNGIGCLGAQLSDGFLRAGYSNEETQVMAYFDAQAQQIGMRSRWDGVGNLFLEYPGEGPEFVETGSHVDTVPRGGNFDGLAGVVAGFCAISSILKKKRTLKRGLRLRIWRLEEGATYNAVYAGSSAAFGKLDSKYLGNRFQGKTLAQAMEEQGCDLSYINRGKATVSQREIDNIAAHIELHIEQGNFLEVQRKDIGIVSSIRGPSRARVFLKGEFDHSGATPMGREYRSDANLALGYILVGIDQLCQKKLREGYDLVQTVGVINSSKDLNQKYKEIYETVITKTASLCYFLIDIRSNQNQFRRTYYSEVERIIKATADDLRVSSEIEFIGESDGIDTLDESLQASLERAATENGYQHQRMISGAGHDAVNVGKQRKSDGSAVPVGMIFIPCLKGKSHCPEEFASNQAIAKGASVLASAMEELTFF